MADSPSPPSPTPPSTPPQYWCHHCDKRVSVETQPDHPDVICFECKFGFVESIPSTPVSRRSDNIIADDTTLGSQFLQVLRLLAQVAHEDDAPPPPPPPPPRPLNPADPTPSDDDDFLRIELQGWENDDDDNEDDEDEENHVSDEDGRENEEENRRQRRDMLRLRFRDFATRLRTENQNRVLDWAEILIGLEDNSIEFRLETDRIIGNPGDYVDGAEYETLLQNLAEAEGKRGAPPAAKSAIENLATIEIKSKDDSYVCAVCKDAVEVGQFVKEMPCGHGYHADCIVPWLGSRNSCPVCRFELPTDDLDYEQERSKKSGNGASSAGNSTTLD